MGQLVSRSVGRWVGLSVTHRTAKTVKARNLKFEMMIKYVMGMMPDYFEFKKKSKWLTFEGFSYYNVQYITPASVMVNWLLSKITYESLRRPF